MARIARPEVDPLVKAVYDDVVDEWAHVVDSEHYVSPHQFRIAKRLALIPNDKNLHYILVELSMKLQARLTRLQEYREVGLANPNPHPKVSYSVYATLLGAKPEDRDAIFAGYPEPVDPETWTADRMYAAVRRYYKTLGNDPKVVQTKEVNLGGYRIKLSLTGDEIEVVVPIGKALPATVIQGVAVSTFTMPLYVVEDGEEQVAV